MTEVELRLYQAWFRHYVNHRSHRLWETMSDAADAGVDIDAIMDKAAADSAWLRERAYRRQVRQRSPCR